MLCIPWISFPFQVAVASVSSPDGKKGVAVLASNSGGQTQILTATETEPSLPPKQLNESELRELCKR